LSPTAGRRPSPFPASFENAGQARKHELAFRKRRVGIEGNDPDTDPLVTRWRAELARLRTDVT
jgi:hypothetical protein